MEEQAGAGAWSGVLNVTATLCCKMASTNAPTTASQRCIFCCTNTIPEKRRIVSPTSQYHADLHEFLTTAVGYQFGAGVVYACRYPCFADIQKAAKRHTELVCLIKKLRASPNGLMKRTTAHASTQMSAPVPAPFPSESLAPLATPPVYHSTWSSSESLMSEASICTVGSEVKKNRLVTIY